jgi:chitinase
MAALAGLLILFTGLAVPEVKAGATGAPGAPSLTQSNWDGGGSYSIIMNMWWGNNGTTWQLFENGALVGTQTLADNSPNAQTASIAFANKPKGSYTYTTKLTNSFGTTAGNTLVYTVTQGSTPPPTVPGIPGGLAATPAGSSQITVTWNAVSGATGYDLQRDSVTVANVTSPHAHTGLIAGSSHTYAVRAKNSAGLSGWSPVVSAQTATNNPVPPATPTGLSAVANGSSQITVTWTAVNGASGYDLQRDGVTVTNVTSPYVHAALAPSSSHTYSVRASNSAGLSAWSAPVTAKTTDGTTPRLPKRIMSGYWHSWGGGPGFIKLRDVDPNWDVINIAFAEPVAPGSTDGRMKLALTGLTADYTVADFKADIRTLQSRGKKVVLSIGGYEGYFSLTSSGAVTTFVNAIKGFVSDYGFNGIDIDLEQNSAPFNSGADPDFRAPTSPKIVNMITALRQIMNGAPSDFILSWAPETFYLQLGFQFYAGLNPYVDARAGCYLPMIHALRDRTTYVQAQLYNSGAILAPDGQSYSMGNHDAVVAMCAMLISGFNVNQNPNYFFPGLRADQVVIAVPASSSAAGSGQISNAELQRAFSTLEGRYPGIRGIMAWSINWDRFQNSNEFARSNRAYLNTKP